MATWLDKIPLPHWATILIAVALLGGAIFLLRRWFRLKTLGVGTTGPYVEFERKSAGEMASQVRGIDQQVVVEKGGSVKNIEQSADGAGIRQKAHGKGGTIEGVKQNAKSR